MKVVRAMLVFMLFIFSQCFASEPTIAILDFSNNSIFEKVKYESLSKGLAEMMISELSQIPELQVVERQQLRAIIEEMQLAQTGLVSEESSIQAGKIIGVDHLVFGSYMVVFGEKIRLDIRIVEVETAKTLLAEKSEGKTKDILKLISKMSHHLLKKLKIQFNKKTFRKVTQTSPEAIIYLSKGLDFEDAGDFNKAKKMYKKALKLDRKLYVAEKHLRKLLKK